MKKRTMTEKPRKALAKIPRHACGPSTAPGRARIRAARLCATAFIPSRIWEESSFRQLQPMAGIVTRLQRQEIEMAKYAYAGASRDVQENKDS